MGQTADSESCPRCIHIWSHAIRERAGKLSVPGGRTNPIKLPSIPAQKYLHLQRVLMEINPRLTPAGMVNMRSEEWGEARTAGQEEQSCLGVPAFPKCGGTGPSRTWQGCSGSLPAWPDLQPPAAIPAAQRVLPSHWDLEEADSTPWAP